MRKLWKSASTAFASGNVTRNTTPSSVACVRICTCIRRDNRLVAPIMTLRIRGADYVSGLGDIVILGEGAKNWAMAAPAAPVAPARARLHSSSIPELSGNQCSPVAQREPVHVEFAGREVKLPGVLHSFLTVRVCLRKGGSSEPPLRTGLLFMTAQACPK